MAWGEFVEFLLFLLAIIADVPYIESVGFSTIVIVKE